LAAHHQFAHHYFSGLALLMLQSLLGQLNPDSLRAGSRADHYLSAGQDVQGEAVHKRKLSEYVSSHLVPNAEGVPKLPSWA